MDWREEFDEKFPLYPDFGEKGDKYMTSLRMDIKSFIENLLEQERKRILNLPCMEEEPVEKDSGPIYLKGEFGGDPIPYHQSIKLPIETNIARNALRRELKEAIINK